jgi:hypothetical protein
MRVVASTGHLIECEAITGVKICEWPNGSSGDTASVVVHISGDGLCVHVAFSLRYS